MQARLPAYDIVLLGVGHSNAHIVRMWREMPISDCRLTCITDFPVATYSGMLPAVLAQQIPRDAMEVDLVRLSASAGARLILGSPTQVDFKNKRIEFTDRTPISYDLLSIGIGSRPVLPEIAPAVRDRVIPIKSMQTFLSRLDSAIAAAIATKRSSEPFRVCVIGAGFGGVEILLCIPPLMKSRLGERPLQYSIISAHAEIPQGANNKVQRIIERELTARNINVIRNQRVVSISEAGVQLDDARFVPFDIVLCAGKAAPQLLSEQLKLAKSSDGFIRVRETLQTLEFDDVFAVGDCATFDPSPLPKAGVYAVREGPVLWENLKRSLTNLQCSSSNDRKTAELIALKPYRPQRNFLKLLNLGDGRAIAEYRNWGIAGKWCYRWKNSIDSKFMAMYQRYGVTQTKMSPTVIPESNSVARCLGCGAKVGHVVLNNVLDRLRISESAATRSNRDDLTQIATSNSRDDVAFLNLSHGRILGATIDYFPAPFDDPFLLGKLAALHSASDLWAKGIRPKAALALCQILPGSASQQEQFLFAALSGAQAIFNPHGINIVGGHTLEGPQSGLGFSLLGASDRELNQLHSKSGLCAGDLLCLSKPLGSGVLLAALMRGDCGGSDFQKLLEAMLESNFEAAELASRHGATGMTDVTGFGLAGHLLEMLNAADLFARLNVSSIPALEGAARLSKSGIESTLAPSNQLTQLQMEFSEAVKQDEKFSLLFDPQTCGGLLFGLPENKFSAMIKDFEARNVRPPIIIGQVLTLSGEHATKGEFSRRLLVERSPN